jgi:hypothetical protein
MFFFLSFVGPSPVFGANPEVGWGYPRPLSTEPVPGMGTVLWGTVVTASTDMLYSSFIIIL